MKQIYALPLLAISLTVLLVPVGSQAQCTCSSGLAATPVVYQAQLAPTNLPSATITMPQFNPATFPGFDLSCVTLYDTLNGTTISGVRNLSSSTALLPPTNPLYSPTGRMEYSFLLVASTDVVGPGINQVKSFNTPYGPDSLGAYGQPDDTITYGPTHLINNYMGSKVSSNTAAYIGTGTVAFSYSLLGNLNVTEGSINYRYQITALYSGNFGLTYYLCPSNPLARCVSYFSCLKNQGDVNLDWLAANFSNSTVYEIQYSKNGEDFSSLGSLPCGTASAGTVSEYHYKYHITPHDMGALYFRIKRIEADGTVSYSAVKLVQVDGQGDGAHLQVYPNPVHDQCKVQLPQSCTGQFKMELISLSGQVLQTQMSSLKGNSSMDLMINCHPARGMYVLRCTDLTQQTQYTTKVQIQ